MSQFCLVSRKFRLMQTWDSVSSARTCCSGVHTMSSTIHSCLEPGPQWNGTTQLKLRNGLGQLAAIGVCGCEQWLC